MRNDRRQDPSLPEIHEGSRSAVWEGEDWDAPGEHTVVCEVDGPDVSASIEFIQVVRPIDDLARDSLAGQTPRDYVGFRTGLELRHLGLSQRGVPDQNFGTPSIQNSGPNPAVPGIAPNLSRHTYTVTPSERARQFRWWVEPQQPIGVQNFHGYSRREANGLEVYDLGTGPSATWIIDRRNVYTIVCEELDDQGQPLGTVARYVQAVQSEDQAQQVEDFREHLQQVTEGISSIESGREVAIQAVLVDERSAQQMPLGLFIGPDAQDPDQIKLVDLTPGASRMDYGGRDVEAALNAFERGNSYPQGRIALEIPANDHGIPATERLVETKGRSDLRQASGNLGLASLGFGVLAVGASFVPGGQVAVPYLVGLSLAAGGTASGLSIADELQQSDPNPISIAVDVLGLASSIVGGAATFQAIRQGTAVTVASRSGRYLIYSGFALDGGATLLISVEGVDQILQILNVEGMTSTQKADAIARIVGMLAAQGALLAVGAQDLKQSLSPGNLAGLSDEAVASLRRYDLDDLPPAQRDGFIHWEQGITDETRQMLQDNPALARTFAEMDPEVRTILTFCNSPCIPSSATEGQVDRIKGLLDQGLDGNNPALREYFHNASNLDDAITQVDGLVGRLGATELTNLMTTYRADNFRKMVDAYGIDNLERLLGGAGNRPDRFRAIQNPGDAPGRYSGDPRFSSLASDPAHGGNITHTSVKEAMAGLEVEVAAQARGRLRPPIERGPAEIEFYDADGIPFDVKAPPSPPAGARFTFNPAQAGDSILRQVRKTFPNKATGNPENIRVILDASYLIPNDYTALWQHLSQSATPEELSRIITINVQF